MSETLKFSIETASPHQFEDLMKIAQTVRDLKGAIVEIGSWKLGTAIPLADSNPHKLVFAFDLFGGNPYPERDEFVHLADVNFEEMKKLAAIEPNLHLMRGMHEETVPIFAQHRLPISMLFMDSDWYESHVVALRHLGPLVEPGGLVVFHDWAFPEVQQAAREELPQNDYEVVSEFEYHPPKQWMQVLRKCHSSAK